MANPKDIVQARIDELESELHEVVDSLKESKNTFVAGTEININDTLTLMFSNKDRVLGLRSAIAELKNIKELV